MTIVQHFVLHSGCLWYYTRHISYEQWNEIREKYITCNILFDELYEKFEIYFTILILHKKIWNYLVTFELCIIRYNHQIHKSKLQSMMNIQEFNRVAFIQSCFKTVWETYKIQGTMINMVYSVLQILWGIYKGIRHCHEYGS